MGIYIPGPIQGKAQYIISEYGARRTTIEDLTTGSAFNEAHDEVIVCVVENKSFDAAAVMPPVPKFMILENKDFQMWAYDQRPKTWLMVPFKNLPKTLKEVLTRNVKSES